MTMDEFKNSTLDSNPPDSLPELLQALWYERKGDWERAHKIAQTIPSPEGSWVHAYLHRREGDHGNARYWYHRAGRDYPKVSLEEEWDEVAKRLLLDC